MADANYRNSNGHVGNEPGLLPSSDEIARAVNIEIRKAIRRHKLLGNPIAVGNLDGSVRWIPPEEIEIDED